MCSLFHPIDPPQQGEIPTVFLPGWGFEGSILRLIHPTPSWVYPEKILDPETFESALLQFLAENSIKTVRIIGWSMGGMLGLDFAVKYPEKVDSLILVSIRSEWPQSEIIELKNDFGDNPEAFLKNFYRKCFLGDKDSYREFCSELQSQYIEAAEMNPALLQRGLDFLQEFTIPGQDPAIPIRIIHGRQDIIAPVREMLELKGSDVELIENCGHIPFLNEKSSLQVELRKQTIMEKFSRAADSYDNYAIVQKEVARKLTDIIIQSNDRARLGTILEIGCGTGNFTSLLAEQFPAAKITALDFSSEMIAKAGNKLYSSSIDFICAEGEEFLQNSPAGSFDLVASNGSLQWFTDHEKALRNIARVLRPKGYFICSIFGPDSLRKLGQGLRILFGYPGNVAAHAFPDMKSLQNILDANFTEGSSEQHLIEKQYDSVRDLLLHIKKTGTGGYHKYGLPSLTISRLKQLDNWFIETYGSCKVTYQIHFLHAVK